MGDFIRISRILNNISRFIQSYAALRSIKHIKSGEDDILIEFWSIKIASVVDRFDRKPYWKLEIIASYVFLILDITNAMIILEHVDMIESPL